MSPLARRFQALRLPLALGAAGAFVGLFALGGGLRLTMRVVALRNRDATGTFTEAGATVGEITLEGTLFLLLFSALVGFAFGVAYAAVRSWLPWRGARRGLAYGAVITAALGSPVLVDADNVDFGFLDGDLTAIVLLLACPLLFGAGLGALGDRLHPHEPRSLRRPGVRLPGITVVALVAAAGLTRLVGDVADILGG